MEVQPSRLRRIESVWVTIILVFIIVASFFAANLLASRVGPARTLSGDHVNVPVYCNQGQYLADHRCVEGCPIGYGPGRWFVLSPPTSSSFGPCMKSDGTPVSIYDLVGLQVSSDGFTSYYIISDVPLMKVSVSNDDRLAYWTLNVSPVVLDTLPTVLSLPSVRTEIGTVGDQVSTLKILRIDTASVTGNQSTLYPLGFCCRTVTLHVGDDVGVACEGLSVKIAWIDSPDQKVGFTVVQSSSPTGGCPICLSGDTGIDTPAGAVNVKILKVGMIVWTVDGHGIRVPAPIVRIGSVQVPPTHEMVHLILADGRELYASPGHPTTDGTTLGQLRVGDLLDGSKVTIAQLTPYNQPYTYDLLPSGPTGFYWANGILIASTLK
jgi:hypothetical protein